MFALNFERIFFKRTDPTPLEGTFACRKKRVRDETSEDVGRLTNNLPLIVFPTLTLEILCLKSFQTQL